MTDPDERTTPSRYDTEGLTKREYFAAHVLQGIISRGGAVDFAEAAKKAVKAADALITALNTL